MKAKVCRQCKKVLPPGYASDLCSLCAVGFVPLQPANEHEPQPDHIIVEGRVLSGVNCPACGAEFTRADFSRRSCSLCGAFYTTERLQQLSLAAKQQSEFLSQQPINAPEDASAVKSWPDDAPLW